ncbi:SMP-30/gluconolactonase/LRE family protein [Streptomyces sp. NPDC097610]|uniref:SMP-30/gluconolactonase/LRE family protein n=1 Tax=Streptomyces sp. NPDC097610 TaxID=3157227 RepID=UPI0033280486
MTAADGPITASVALDEQYVLGEGPYWDRHRGVLLWVDIKRGTVMVGRLTERDSIEVVERVQFEGTIGAVATSEDNDWIVAGEREVFRRTSSGKVLPGVSVIPAEMKSRLNDGKPDPAGRYLVGSLALGDAENRERLVAVDSRASVRVIDQDLSLSNGLAWSPDGSMLYNVDSYRRRVYARPYDVATGATGPRSLLIESDTGYPDGMCSDAQGHLWIAMWGLGEVRRYSPDGLLETTVRVPAPHVSSVAFAGPDLETLVITTATSELSDDQLRRWPLSGRLFTARPGVRGLRQSSWAGTL